ncbi:MAG: hypothetical protein N0C84_07515 [Candidatus Thiodiazotropha taylori]|uniref:Uncharacterized protein n=1 Tax=Candidatus Thiodiazotropha taylori TaxID=2792791 RepID=A0A9E4N4Q9_9GAMM|nr:hypothetical protein [Candidatus Thiodiazotropha taylori]MCW4256302.1 hypothetical protein [Candidatus Thiodiazotropha taylori]
MHWTYSQSETDSDLQQGDLLSPTDELREILKEVHPHFCADKYIGFVITTQTCDLARRGKKSPKAHYINIAAVRSLKDTAAHIFERAIRPVSNGVFRKSDRATAKDLLHRIFNQNEQALGLFYFHPDADIGLGDHSVAFLRIAIAMRAEHYEVLLKARTGGLDPAFQAKLGWLVGNLYSRAATPDWADYEGGKDELKQLESEYLKEQIPGHGPTWVDDELIVAGQQNNVNFDGFDSSGLIEELEQYRPLPSIEKLIREVADQAKNALKINPHTKKQVDEVFNNRGDHLFSLFEKHLQLSEEDADGDTRTGDALSSPEVKDAIIQSLHELKEAIIDMLSVSDENLEKLANRLKNNGKIKKLLK